MNGALAQSLYEEQARIIASSVSASLDIWNNLDPTRFTASWVQSQIGDQLFLSVSRAQELAAMAADVYTDLLLLDQGVEITADGDFVPSSLSGVAADGRPLDSLLLQPLIQANVAAAGGGTLADAMAAGAQMLTRIVGTQVADAGRQANSIGIAARPRTGWVRMVEPRACSRCVILAGRFYRWSNGFDRHPLCKCRNIPSAEDVDGIRSDNDPMAHFNSLSEKEQNAQFTVAGARAIRDGADIQRVVNARRGAMGLSTASGRLTKAEKDALGRGGLVRTDVNGRAVKLTTEGTTIRAAAAGRARVNGTPRLMPESIYEIAADREDAVRLLKRFGYLS